jgi:hypothetical protein
VSHPPEAGETHFLVFLIKSEFAIIGTFVSYIVISTKSLRL